MNFYLHIHKALIDFFGIPAFVENGNIFLMPVVLFVKT